MSYPRASLEKDPRHSPVSSQQQNYVKLGREANLCGLVMLVDIRSIAFTCAIASRQVNCIRMIADAVSGVSTWISCA